MLSPRKYTLEKITSLQAIFVWKQYNNTVTHSMHLELREGTNGYSLECLMAGPHWQVFYRKSTDAHQFLVQIN